MSLVTVDGDPWMREYESCEKLYREILELLNKRDGEPKASDSYARISSNVRVRLKQFDSEVLQLFSKLKEISFTRTVTPDEAERRQRLIEDLKTKGIRMQRRFNDRDMMSKMNRAELLEGRYSQSDDDQMLPDTPGPSWQSVQELREQQKRIAQEQEAGIDELYKTISRQKNIAIRIGDEVDIHNDILEDLNNRMERTTGGIQRETDQIATVTRRDNTCSYWIVIIILFISIIVLILI